MVLDQTGLGQVTLTTGAPGQGAVEVTGTTGQVHMYRHLPGGPQAQVMATTEPITRAVAFTVADCSAPVVQPPAPAPAQ